MRICCINITSEASSQLFLPVITDNLDRARNKDSEVTIESIAPGIERALDANSSYFSLLNKVSIVDKALAAEAKGYDAIVVLCFMDPAVQEAREVVDIPVVGIGEASMHLACQLGRKFAVVTLNEPKMILEIEAGIAAAGLRERTARTPVRAIEIPSNDWLRRGMSEPGWVADEIRKTAELCVKDGAEVVIVGCVGLAPLASLGGLTKLDGIEVPVLDCTRVGLKIAELRATLSRDLGCPAISRAGRYQKPRDKDLSRVRSSFGLVEHTR